MLLSLTKPVIRLFIGEQVVAAQCRGKGAKAVLSDIRSVASVSGDVEIEAALEQVLLGRNKGLDVEIVLGQPHIFYITLPWSHELHRHEARATAARGRFVELFGERYGRHKVCVGPARFGMPIIAAFMSPELIDMISRVAARGGFRLRSMEPQLSCLWNMLRGRIKAGNGVLEVVETGFVTMAKYENGAISDVGVAPKIARKKPFHGPSQLDTPRVVYRIDSRGVLSRDGITQWQSSDAMSLAGVEHNLLACVLRRGLA